MALEDLFVQVLVYAQTMNLVKLGKILLDGTKIKANASKHKALSHGHIEKLEVHLCEEVHSLLAKATATDQQETNDEHDLPAEIARREQRLQVLARFFCVMAPQNIRQSCLLSDRLLAAIYIN